MEGNDMDGYGRQKEGKETMSSHLGQWAGGRALRVSGAPVLPCSTKSPKDARDRDV